MLREAASRLGGFHLALVAVVLISLQTSYCWCHNVIGFTVECSDITGWGGQQPPPVDECLEHGMCVTLCIGVPLVIIYEC